MQNAVEVLLINLTVFAGIKKVKRMMTRKIYGELREDWMLEERRSFDKPAYCNGYRQMVKAFNQKCVMFFENPSVFAFKHCGRQITCEKCYQNKSDVGILQCIICTA